MIPRALLTAVVVMPLCLSACSPVHSFDRNDVFALPNGTVLVKGFGGSQAGTVTCVVPTSPYSARVSDDWSVGGEYMDAKAGLAKRSAAASALAYEQTERMQALSEILAQLCFAYGNGVFGRVENEETFKRYRTELREVVDSYLRMSSERAAAENPPAPAPTGAHPAPAAPATK